MYRKGPQGRHQPRRDFLSTHARPVPGSCCAGDAGSTQPLLCVNYEALVDSGGVGPRRLSVGLDQDRLAMLHGRHCTTTPGWPPATRTVFVNAAGSVRIKATGPT